MGGPESYDPVMLELFRAEMDTHLPALSQGLLALEKGRAGEKDLEAMMRAAHSIKGAARIVGIDSAVRVAHALEDCFSAAQGQRLTLSSEAVDVLLQGVDALQRICSLQPESQVTEGSIQSLLDQITALREGTPPVPAGRLAASDVSVVEVQWVTSTEKAQEHCLRLPVLFDDGAARSLRHELAGILERKPSRLRLDFAQVQHVSVSALSLLALLARDISLMEPALAVNTQAMSDPIAALLRTTGLDRAFGASE